jgi:hypothetical protein
MIYFLFGVLIGYFSWGFSLEMTILSLSLFFAYLLLEKRWYLFLFTLGYYLVGSRGLCLGVELGCRKPPPKQMHLFPLFGYNY